LSEVFNVTQTSTLYTDINESSCQWSA